MKYLACLSSLLCLSVLLVGQTKKDLILFPEYQIKDANWLEVSSIKKNKENTIFYMDSYAGPGDWRSISSETVLKGNNTGKTYKLVRSESIELNKRFTMPASGNVPFSLIFEAVDPKDNSVDIIGKNEQSNFSIKELKLYAPKRKQRIRCHLSGKVFNRPQSSRLVILRCGEIPRTNKFLSIPIRNGSFEYTLYVDQEEVFELVFWEEELKGCWLSATKFFAENGDIRFEFYPGDHQPIFTINTRSPLTSEMLAFENKQKEKFNPIYNQLSQEQDSLEKANLYHSEAYRIFWDKYETLKEDRNKLNALYKERNELEKSGAFYTKEGNELNKQFSDVEKQRDNFAIEYIKTHPTLFSLFLIKDKTETIRPYVNTPAYIDLYQNIYKQRFAGHRYTKDMENITGAFQVEVGKTYLDYAVSDLKGNEVQIQDLLKGNVTLVDLWATWCGSCRRNSISMIPIYHKYKDKGFNIIGIAREKGSIDAMVKAIQKDGYLWKNFVDLDDKHQIWVKHRLSNSAGGTFLIGKDGKVLAIDPDPKELEEILQRILQ